MTPAGGEEGAPTADPTPRSATRRDATNLHGTPDSRWSRHPDDGLAVAARVRLLAVDRPGCGRSDHDPGRTLGTVADNLAAACARLGITSVGVLAWSAGAPYAVALAARQPDLVSAVGLAAPLVPVTAYATPEVAEVAGPGRRLFAEMAAEMAPDEVAAEVAPYGSCACLVLSSAA